MTTSFRALILAYGVVASGPKWLAGPPANLDRRLRTAARLEAEDIWMPVKSVRAGMLLRAPR